MNLDDTTDKKRNNTDIIEDAKNSQRDVQVAVHAVFL